MKNRFKKNVLSSNKGQIGNNIDSLPEQEDEGQPLNIKKILTRILILLLVVPILFGMTFYLAQSFEQSVSDYVCYITEEDYLIHLALEASRRGVMAFIPFKAWSLFAFLIAEIAGILFLLYEILRPLINSKRKDGKHLESLLKRNKLILFNFFISLIAMGFIGVQYTDTIKKNASQEVGFLNAKLKNKENFFMLCSVANKVQLSNKNKIVNTKLSEVESSSKLNGSDSNTDVPTYNAPTESKTTNQ